MTASEEGRDAVLNLCTTLEETFSALTQMTDKTNSDDLRPAPLPSDKKSLEFTQAVLRHSLTPSTIIDLVKSLQAMRSDVARYTSRLETTFHRVQFLYNIMNNELARSASRDSSLSTATNLTVRIQFAGWLKRREGTWGFSRQERSTSVSHPVSFQTPSHFIFCFSFLIFFNLTTRQAPRLPSSPQWVNHGSNSRRRGSSTFKGIPNVSHTQISPPALPVRSSAAKNLSSSQPG